ncbi:hypothetical protein Pan153_45900 [Gimesia panareensis]|uniref:Secreted protein n=1 Tax=Gimesia panareensis TaxID=2527978 RepID=A0A518FUA1_9PLAN|nr:hypothetical protein [Gimesia panareensis]QDV19921.1 hypothetical protein Pan153_45900 [Gimesia panareensis]
MPRYLYSILLVLCLTPIQFGCGSDAPMTPETDADPVEELDPASEADAVNNAKKDT